MSHVFISYSHKDADFVEELVRELKNARIDYWLDKEFLHAGDHWEQKIDKGIEEAIALLLVMSPSAKESEYVTYEWAYAFGVSKKIIPIYLETVEWHPKLDPSKIQYIDFREGKEPYHQLIATLLRLKNSNNLPEESEYLNRNKYLALQGENEQIRKNAIENIVKYDDEQVPDILVEISETARLIDSKTFSAIRLAEKFADERAINGLVAGISKNNSYQSRAVTVIQTFGEKAIDGLVELLDAEWSEARYEAIRILGNWRVEKVANKFIQMMETEDLNKVYAQLATATVQLGDKRAIPYIVNAIINRHFMNTQVIQALCAFNDKQSIPALFYVLQKSSYDSKLAMVGLIELGEVIKPYLLEELDMECSSNNDLYLSDLLKIVENLPDDDYYDIAMKFVDCNYPYTHASAVAALGAIGNPRCIPKIGALLSKSKNRDEMWVYTSALGKINHEDIYPYLIKTLDKFQYGVMSALQFKLYYDHQQSLKILTELLYHQDVEVVDATLNVLRQSKKEEALAVVKEWEQIQNINDGDNI